MSFNVIFARACLLLLPVILISLGSGLCADLSPVVEAIHGVLPEGWWAAEQIDEVKPNWSYSGERIGQLVLVGPAKTGYRYLDDKREPVATEYSRREAIYIWVAPSTFDDGWTFTKRLKNLIAITPILRPQLIVDNRIKVFGMEGIYIVDTRFEITSPPGTVFAYPIEFERSWNSWSSDIKKAFKHYPKLINSR